MFPGNYTVYSEKKAVIRRAEYNAYLNQQQEITPPGRGHCKTDAPSTGKNPSERAESREKLLDKIEVLDKPRAVPQADMQHPPDAKHHQRQ